MYVPEDVKPVRRQDLEDETVEAIWIEVKTRLKPLLFCTVYRPLGAIIAWMDKLAYMVERASQERMEIVISGDFNCNMVNPDSTGRKLTEIMSEYNFVQLVTSPHKSDTEIRDVD